jgi:colanic acid/amylovoran biosynthesis glycosyltransferase
VNSSLLLLLKASRCLPGIADLGCVRGAESAGGKPVRVGVFCPTFLRPEMLHVYRQVAGLHKVQPVVYAFKRECQDRFPLERINLLPRSPFRGIRRIWQTQICRVPQQALPSEVQAFVRAMTLDGCGLLHIYFGNNALFWAPLFRKTDLPLVVSFHGADVQVGMRSAAALGLLRQTFARAMLVLARSDSLASELAARGCPERKLRIQRTGIPVDQYRYHLRQKPTDGRWELLQACRLVEKKGLVKTIRAFSGFQTRWPFARLTVAGDGPLRSALETLTAELRLVDSVRFTGFLNPEDLLGLYKEAHVFLHPSETGRDGNQEGIPNSLLEAMATGLPVIATRHGGIPEAIESGRSGLLVNEGATDQLLGALLRVIEDDDLRTTLGHNAAQVVRCRFDLEQQVSRLENFYLQAMTPS